MDDPLGPPTHVPDPAKRYRVLGVTRGAEIYIEILDAVENRAVVLTFPEALTVAADITLEIARVFRELATHRCKPSPQPQCRSSTPTGSTPVSARAQCSSVICDSRRRWRWPSGKALFPATSARRPTGRAPARSLAQPGRGKRRGGSSTRLRPIPMRRCGSWHPKRASGAANCWGCGGALDLERGTLTVQQTIGVLAGAPCVKPPKTYAGRRVVKLSADVIAALGKHRLAWAARKLAAAEWADGDLVFCTGEGKPLNPNNLYRNFTAIIARAGVPPIRLHDLRHTHATLLLAAGTPIKAVSERLGHSKTSITLDTYAHVLPDMQDRAVDAIDAALSRAVL